MEIQEIVDNLEGMSVSNDAELVQVRLVKAQIQAMGVLEVQLERIADSLNNLGVEGIYTYAGPD